MLIGMQRDVRLGWVGAKVDLLDGEDIVGWVGAEVQRVIAWNFVFFLDHNLVASHPRRRRGSRDGAQRGNEEGGELHSGGGWQLS